MRTHRQAGPTGRRARRLTTEEQGALVASLVRPPPMLDPASVLRLQRTAGNRAVHALVGPVQQGGVWPGGCAPTVVVARQPTPGAGSARGGGAGPPSAGGGTSAPAACDPRALSRADYLREPGTSVEDFGLTIMDTTQVRLAWSADPVGRGSRVKAVLHSAPALPAIPSVFTTAGRFAGSDGPTGTKIVARPTKGPCVGASSVPTSWMVTTDGARQLRLAEQEHCADFRYAFATTMAVYSKAVSRAARAGTWASEAALRRALARDAGGVDPDDWADRWANMVQRTRRRDSRKHHDPVITDTHMPVSGSQCYVLLFVTERSLPEVGLHSSAKIMGTP